MSAPKLSNVRVMLETAAGSTPSKVICVSWELADEKQKIDGEWLVDWDDMYPELPEEVARTGQGGYLALQHERAGSGDTDASGPRGAMIQLKQLRDQARFDEPGPLSTARLLEFENGPNLGELQDDLPAFFAARPVVQAPEQILSDPGSVSKKTEVLFLLAPATTVPPTVRIYFVPTWTPPNTPPTLLSEIQQSDYRTGEGLHTAWATKRFEDLESLQEIANELEQEGSRGTTQGRLKVGVEGGGMDEEAVRREGYMVGEEQAWVVEKFLTKSDQEPEVASNPVMDPFAGLGISTGMHFSATSSVRAPPPGLFEEEEEEDLFALPLSPRSPDMTVSPFSFRDDVAPGFKPPFSSKLRQVESIDASMFGSVVTPAKSESKAPPTPPREA